jgi:hypothetical protein
MTAMQLYALVVHPLIALAILWVFAAVLMKQSLRRGQRITEIEAQRRATEHSEARPRNTYGVPSPARSLVE